MRYYFVLVLIFNFCFVFSQTAQNEINNIQEIPIPYSNYKELKKNSKLSLGDSIGYFISNKDTLIRIKGGFVLNKKKFSNVPYEYKDEIFLNTYVKIAFKATNLNDTISKNRMVYWKKPIKIFYTNTVPKTNRTTLNNFIKDTLNKIDSLDISIVNNKKFANYIIDFIDFKRDNQFKTISKNYNEGYFVVWNNKAQIIRGEIKIDTDKIENTGIDDILKWRFYQSLGNFKGIKNLPCQSYLSDCNTGRKILDKEALEILSYHYSYGICKGTGLKEFKESHKKAKEMLKFDKKNKLIFSHPID
ncbi:hypothetical protein [Croceivirga sp. JEA036]|uniref:hypothetical protein n=1 Tax=Croceivirga sp. JEA036 TaxID=2721162 RepID=UPI00143A7D94|nr:hypothetical protein [Croceivirga sp. JEA036]NJB35405.1 hypothetical protein [Croceivirga sp. JEA036]